MLTGSPDDCRSPSPRTHSCRFDTPTKTFPSLPHRGRPNRPRPSLPHETHAHAAVSMSHSSPLPEPHWTMCLLRSRIIGPTSVPPYSAGRLWIVLRPCSSARDKYPADLYGLPPGSGQGNGRPGPGILRLVPDRANVACCLSLDRVVHRRAAVGWVHWPRPGTGSAGAVREISSLRSPENSQLSVIVRISAARPWIPCPQSPLARGPRHAARRGRRVRPGSR
jgi:hypothetical protein